VSAKYPFLSTGAEALCRLGIIASNIAIANMNASMANRFFFMSYILRHKTELKKKLGFYRINKKI